MHEYVLSGFEEQLEQIRKASKKVSQSFTVYKIMPTVKKVRNAIIARLEQEYIQGKIKDEDYFDIMGRAPDSRLEKLKKNYVEKPPKKDYKDLSYVHKYAEEIMEGYEK